MCINREMDKEDVVHIYNGILNNTIFSKRMDLEIATLNEISQTKEKYHMASLICEI